MVNKVHDIVMADRRQILLILNGIFFMRSNKKISVFRVTGLKILGRVGTHFYLIIFFSGKNFFLCILKGILPIYIFTHFEKHFAFQNA